MDVGKRGAGNDLRMSIDDKMIPLKEDGRARRQAEKHPQHQALTQPPLPDHLALCLSNRIDRTYHA